LPGTKERNFSGSFTYLKQLASLGDSVGVCTPTELEYKLSCRIHLPLVEAGDFFGVMLKTDTIQQVLGFSGGLPSPTEAYQ
jgi:hypothetical protein